MPPLAFSVFALLAACGGSGSDDDGDEGSEIDAGGGSGPDAAAGTADIGAPCSPASPDSCPLDTPVCVVISETATAGFCTVPCGVTPPGTGGEQPDPPAGGDGICMTAYGDGSATPSCAIVFEPEDGMVPWACGLACGETPDGNFGTCPSNLTCVQNDPAQNGFCLPP
ncbi:MAG TPA: hypothetical protein VK698_03650 [Kofleriaceae bacterium]|nr:hypothetical protein [Kofleriaceae bacterium]